MKWTVLAASAALALTTLPASTAPARDKLVEREKSADLLSAVQLKNPVEKTALPLVLSPAALAAAPTIADVGDPDSFGKNVIYLGLAQTLPVIVTDDCTGSDPTLERCLISAPPPAITSFNETALGTMNLPAKATKSLLCFTLTPFITVNWQNFTGVPALARFTANADITITNSLLNDPTLIDPNTGLPFGGSLQVSLSTWRSSHTLQNGEVDNESSSQSRSCIAGLIGKRALVENYGLTEAQATNFFKKPMTLSFASRGTVALSAFTQYFYGLRVYGDAP